MKHRADVCARALIPALLWIAACTSGRPPESYGGETHWLSGCGADDECGAGSCLCGVCTDACDGDLACKKGPRPAHCYSAASPDLTSQCEADRLRKVAGVCLATCAGDAECTSGTVCLHGACVNEEAKAAVPAKGETSSTLDAGVATVATGLPRAQDFNHVDAAVDFTAPLSALPAPQTEFANLPTELQGSWVELGQDGMPCDVARENAPLSRAGAICMHLDLEMTESGALRGTAHWDLDPINKFLSGPYAPAADPDNAYPVEVPADADTYLNLRTTVPNVTYRVFDAAVQHGQLSFWISPNDLWTDWCALQTSYPRTTAQGKMRYRCVPPSADESNTNPGKLALCGSAEDDGGCFDKDGYSVPCLCIDDAGDSAQSDLRCTSPTCECTADECHADLRATSIAVSLVIGTASLEGWLEVDIEQQLKLIKVQP